jgi:hypothetical protein
MQRLVLLLRVEMLRSQRAVLAPLPMIAYMENADLRKVPKFASNHVLLLNSIYQLLSQIRSVIVFLNNITIERGRECLLLLAQHANV